jgi:hypothetical protein
MRIKYKHIEQADLKSLSWTSWFFPNPKKRDFHEQLLSIFSFIFSDMVGDQNWHSAVKMSGLPQELCICSI